MRGGRAIILPTTDKADEFDRDYEVCVCVTRLLGSHT